MKLPVTLKANACSDTVTKSKVELQLSKLSQDQCPGWVNQGQTQSATLRNDRKDVVARTIWFNIYRLWRCHCPIHTGCVANLHAFPLMLLATCVNTPIYCSVSHNLHAHVARCPASCVNGASLSCVCVRVCVCRGEALSAFWVLFWELLAESEILNLDLAYLSTRPLVSVEVALCLLATTTVTTRSSRPLSQLALKNVLDKHGSQFRNRSLANEALCWMAWHGLWCETRNAPVVFLKTEVHGLGDPSEWWTIKWTSGHDLWMNQMTLGVKSWRIVWCSPDNSIHASLWSWMPPNKAAVSVSRPPGLCDDKGKNFSRFFKPAWPHRARRAALKLCCTWQIYCCGHTKSFLRTIAISIRWSKGRVLPTTRDHHHVTM